MSEHTEMLLRCTCPPLSHVRSPIGTKRHCSPVKISLQHTRCPSTAIAVDDLDDGAVFRQQLQLDGSFQRGRHPAIGVQYGRILREHGYRSGAQRSFARVRLFTNTSVHAGVVSIHTGQCPRRLFISVVGYSRRDLHWDRGR